jgi:hypothetical protein
MRVPGEEYARAGQMRRRLAGLLEATGALAVAVLADDLARRGAGSELLADNFEVS